MLGIIRARWNQLIVFSTAVMALLSRFVFAPPYALRQQVWYKFGGFFVALAVGLWLVPVKLWASRKQLRGWWIAAVCLAILSCSSFLLYTSLIERWSLPYFRDERVVIGSTRTPEAERDAAILSKDGSEVDDLRLLRYVDGDPYQVWRGKEITRRSYILTGLYLCTILLLASAIITVTQAIYCASNETS